MEGDDQVITIRVADRILPPPLSCGPHVFAMGQIDGAASGLRRRKGIQERSPTRPVGVLGMRNDAKNKPPRAEGIRLKNDPVSTRNEPIYSKGGIIDHG